MEIWVLCGCRFLLGVLCRGGDRGDQQERRAGVAVGAGARRLRRRGRGVRRVHELFEFIVGNHGLTSHHGGELAIPRHDRCVPGGEAEPERGQHRGLPECDTQQRARPGEGRGGAAGVRHRRRRQLHIPALRQRCLYRAVHRRPPTSTTASPWWATASPPTLPPLTPRPSPRRRPPPPDLPVTPWRWREERGEMGREEGRECYPPFFNSFFWCN